MIILQNILILSLFVQPLWGHDFAEEIQFGDSTFQLQGSAQLTYSWFRVRVYDLAYYTKSSTSQNDELLLLKYHRDIPKKWSIRGWEEGLKKNFKNFPDQYQSQWQWFQKYTPEISRQDKLFLIRKGHQVTMKLNQEVLTTIEDEKLAEMILSPWIGENPIDADIKKNLRPSSR